MKNIRLFHVALLLFCALFVQDSRAQDDNPFNLPEGARARLGKGKLSGDVAYSPDGTRLAVVSSFGIWLYDAHTYTEVALLTDHTDGIRWAVFAPDGKTLATVSQDQTAVSLWDADSGALKTRLEGLAEWAFEGYISWVNSVAFAPDGKTLAIATGRRIFLWDMDRILARGDDTIQLWDTDIGGALKTTLEGHTSEVTSVAFAPDGKTLASASASSDGTVRLWDTDSGELKARLEGHKFEVNSVAFAPDGKTIASAGWDQTVRLWEADSGAPKTILKGYKDRFSSVGFSPDGKTIAAAVFGHEGLLREDDIVTAAIFGHEIWLWEADSGVLKTTLEGHTNEVTSVVFSPDGKTIASASDDGTVRLWDANSGTRKTILEGHNRGWFFSATFAPDGKTIASIHSADVLLWDADSGTRKTSLKGHTDQVYSVAFAPDGKTIASASDDGTVRLWDANSAALKARLEGYADWRYSVAFSPDGKTIATTDRVHVRLWDADSGTRKTSLKGHTDQVYSVAFSPDGKTIASASDDGTILLWDVDNGTLKTALKDHTDEITSVMFSPDGKTIATADRVHVRLWDTDRGTLKATLEGHTDQVYSVAFSPDGKTIASASDDDTILLWDMSLYITPSTPTAVQSAATRLPTQTALLANFPNPLNPDTYIPYQLHAPAQVRLSIYDVRGALVREIDVGYRAAGQYLTSTSAAYWDGRDHRGQHVASGVYLYRLQAGPVAQVRKMVLVK